MKLLNEILRGILIGIANIIPGVSGGTMAVSMGIYDDIIYSITHLFTDMKKSIRTLFPYILGAGIGIVCLSFIIEYLFLHFPIQTNLCFIGLILGGLPIITKRIKIKRSDFSHSLIFILFFALIIGMQLLGGQGTKDVTIQISLFEIIKLFLIGAVASATMVIPGVSGSMMLMIIGYYNPIISHINLFIKALVALNFDQLIQSSMILVPFGLGVVIGIFLIAKIIEILLKHYESHTYCAILGLVIASPIAILMGIHSTTFNLPILLTSAITFIIGLIIARFAGQE
ncbi:DUF368 domain-containing protein [Beduini massiliensis]|uniref:DUF368 domain-containing protein n=1 Tax=Beduini massiliensis TaxID=1585974 RepID=UPI00059A962E|nr:DUF368 domain-containing protein [Beduini massiliensis]